MQVLCKESIIFFNACCILGKTNDTIKHHIALLWIVMVSYASHRLVMVRYAINNIRNSFQKHSNKRDSYCQNSTVNN